MYLKMSSKASLELAKVDVLVKYTHHIPYFSFTHCLSHCNDSAYDLNTEVVLGNFTF